MNRMRADLTLQDLAQTALGVPKITSFNLSVLQNLIDVILKKLDCQSDTVTVTGYESQCLQQLLRQSKISPLPFNDENVSPLSAKLKRLSVLEDRLAAVKQKLDDHMSQVRKYNVEKSKEETSYLSAYWQHYSRDTEDMCTIPTMENKIGCYLITNHHFNVRLMRMLGEPLRQRLLKSAQKIEKLHLEVLDFTRRAHERYKLIMVADGCVIEIEELRKKIIEHEAQFLSTIDEIQQQLDRKLKKVFLVELKIYLQKKLDSMTQFVEKLKKSHESCPGKPTLPQSNTTDCLSCGGVKTCLDRPFYVSEPYNWPQTAKPVVPPFCGCAPTCLDPRHLAALRQHIEAAKARAEAESPQPKLVCQPPQVLGELRGEDGSYYLRG